MNNPQTKGVLIMIVILAVYILFNQPTVGKEMEAPNTYSKIDATLSELDLSSYTINKKQIFVDPVKFECTLQTVSSPAVTYHASYGKNSVGDSIGVGSTCFVDQYVKTYKCNVSESRNDCVLRNQKLFSDIWLKQSDSDYILLTDYPYTAAIEHLYYTYECYFCEQIITSTTTSSTTTTTSATVPATITTGVVSKLNDMPVAWLVVGGVLILLIIISGGKKK